MRGKVPAVNSVAILPSTHSEGNQGVFHWNQGELDCLPAALQQHAAPLLERESVQVARLRPRNALQRPARDFVNEQQVLLFSVALTSYADFAIPWTFPPREPNKILSTVAIKARLYWNCHMCQWSYRTILPVAMNFTAIILITSEISIVHVRLPHLALTSFHLLDTRPYRFRIHVHIHHYVAALYPPNNVALTYASMYLLDSEQALHQRIGRPKNGPCDVTTMMMIQDLLDQINPYAHLFLHMVEIKRDDRLAGQETRNISGFFYRTKTVTGGGATILK